MSSSAGAEPAPARAAGTRPEAAAVSSRSPAGQAKDAPLDVLVVDDDADTRRSMALAIEQLGHHCMMGQDGLEALELRRTKHVDVILSAWKMPRLDGLELCRRIRAADATDRRATYTYFILMADFGDREHFLRGMDAGADDYHTKPVDLHELQARLASAARVVGVYRKLAEQNEVLRRNSLASFEQARIDPLTGVANRLRMDEDLAVLWAQMKRYERRCSGALCDIDWFKHYNDAHGHLAGDEVLRLVARTIRERVRRGDTIYRYGGEEFFVVLPEQSAPEAARAMERVRRAIERLEIPTIAGSGVVTISVGVASPGPGDGAVEDWLRRTDRALYAAKAAGRNRIVVE